MVENYINEELSFIERKILFNEKLKELLPNITKLNSFEISCFVYKTLILDNFENVIPIISEEIYREKNVNDIIDGICDINYCSFYIKYEEKEVFLIFKKSSEFKKTSEEDIKKINIKVTNGIIENCTNYEEINLLSDISSITNDFIDSIKSKIDSLYKAKNNLDNNIKLLTNIIE